MGVTCDVLHVYRIRPNRRPGRLSKFVLYHYCQKIVKWAIIRENKVNSQEKDRQVGLLCVEGVWIFM